MEKRASDNGFLGFSGKVILLALVLLVLGDHVNGTRNAATSAERDLEIERKLKLMNKPAVKSIQSEDGDIIDCVDINKQPAFDHPLLKNHKIQMRPSMDEKVNEEAASSNSTVRQLWRKSGSCPEGTIPIRRVQKSHLLRAPSLENYGMKGKHVPNSMNDLNSRMYADAVLLTQGYRYNGVHANINVWNPYVEADDEYTSAQIWVVNGPYYLQDTIQTGWTVNPTVYGDKRTRFFSYWLSNTTGCYDLFCSGFVQTSSEIALGGAIEPISTGQQQNEITLSIALDTSGSNWWLVFNNKTNIGYWPSSLFIYLFGAATTVFWGGEVYSQRLGTPHTLTAMGSGNFAGYRFGRSCFMSQIRIRDNSLVWKYPEWVSTYQSQYNCYDVLNDKEYSADPFFYFGGPGRNDRCP
ncbi:hypothetical protein CKAN_01147700 [Cinnamomum micranthum f. kanehirae]|uniref:Neprosin PEP catalytic domain-containing protein n=1 Tax=Cinnamomum micranthum f. kanehirae TaxID=337451 RepID=A0A3S3MUQ7_9MAGN|nr:hypothetical protein CKAN_01147700 [Cinnamomum micranthum f. kanehirae]